MTTATFTPADRWLFETGHAVYYVPSGHSWIRPTALIPATVLSCRTLRGCPLGSSKASILRSDKPRPTSVSAGRLVYRGYCEACEVPAVVGDGDTLTCPQCHEPATPMPLPDRLVVYWYPLGEWLDPRVVRRQLEHPTWSWIAVREAADEVLDTAYDGMLERLKLRRLYTSSDFSEPIAERRYDDRLFETLKAAAILGDGALFLSTHQELSMRQADTARSRYLAQRLQSLSPERLATLLDLAGESDEPPPAAPPAVSLIPLPERPESDAEPDGADEMTRWLEQQFRKGQESA